MAASVSGSVLSADVMYFGSALIWRLSTSAVHDQMPGQLGESKSTSESYQSMRAVKHLAHHRSALMPEQSSISRQSDLSPSVSQPLPRITFGMIVLNGEPFLEYNLRSLYPFAPRNHRC